MTTKCIEYNLINNIPVIYPNITPINFNFCPRYTIADTDRLLHCFDSDKIDVVINNNCFKYVKVHINTMINKDIEALYYYILVDNNLNYAIDFKNPLDVFEWIESSDDHHYVIVTTPVLRYNDILYSIANDNNISIVIHNQNDQTDDDITINKLLEKNCFTICDNFNIVIALYHKNLLNKLDFWNTTFLLKKMKHCYYTDSKWFHIINQHRILNACDLPSIMLFTKPHMIDNDIYELYENTLFNNDYIYMQTEYKKNILFTTTISSSYPHTNVRMMKLVFGEKWYENFWRTNKNSLFKYYPEFENCVFINDMTGLFASFAHVEDMWDYWCKNKQILIASINKSFEAHNNIMIQCFLSLFRLYNIGFDGVTIKKCRIRCIWKDIFQYSNHSIVNIFDTLVLVNSNVNIILSMPYIFISDVHEAHCIDYISKKIMLVPLHNDFIYKHINLYSIIYNNTSKNSIFYFHKNILKKRMMLVLMTIYKKFNMYSNSNSNHSRHVLGYILINYLSQHKNYLF